MCTGLCPKCLYIRELTRHHIYPVRFFGRRNERTNPILHLCRTCHDGIERIIPHREVLTKQDYLQIAREFLTEEQ